MNSPIKPPGSTSITPPVKGAESTAPAESVKETFQASMDKVASASQAQGKAPTSAVDVVQNVVQRLQAGEIDATAAMDQLVEYALQQNGAELLNPSQRIELEAVLRGALNEDPTLQGLKNDLER